MMTAPPKKEAMELSNSLLLNEDIILQLPESKKALFILEWLRHLNRILPAANRADLKGNQKQLQQQLTKQISSSPGPPTRFYLAKCFGYLFSIGDSVGLFELVNFCNDQIKQKDDPATLQNRLAALEILGELYGKLGRMVGRSYEETVANCLKGWKSAESQTRIEILRTLEKVIAGMGSAAHAQHKDLYALLKTALVDRCMPVRIVAAQCLEALVREGNLAAAKWEEIIKLSCTALEASNYDVRVAVASLLATVFQTAITGPVSPSQKLPAAEQKTVTVEDVFALLSSMFLKGGLKTGASEMIRGTTVVAKEVRVGTTHCYIAFFQRMGSRWIEKNLSAILNHLMELIGNPRCSLTHVDAIYARKCVSCIIGSSVLSLLTEKAQLVAARELLNILFKHASASDVNSSDSPGGEGRPGDSRQQVLICALEQLASIIVDLDSVTINLMTESGHNLIDVSLAIVVYPVTTVQLYAAWTLRSIVKALPTQMVPVLNRLLAKIEDTKTFPEGILGCSYGMAAVIGAISDSALGIPHRLIERAFLVAEEHLRSANSNSRLSQQRTEGAWMILGAITTLGSACMRKYLSKLLLLWRQCFPRSDNEIESEKLRGDAFTWQVSLLNRAGALAALNGFLINCPELATEDVLKKVAVPVQSGIALLHNTSALVKSYGQHLKLLLASMRLRLYEALMALPMKVCTANYAAVIKEIVAEFTLVDNTSNTTTSVLKSLCRTEDVETLGLALQDTDQKLIEEQLQPNSASGSGCLEHDPISIYARADVPPDPLPVGVTVIDLSIQLFGRMFASVPTKHQQQILEHLAVCLRQAKPPRQTSMLNNVFAAIISVLKNMNDNKIEGMPEPVIAGFVTLINFGIANQNALLRVAAGEALGRLALVMADRKFVADTVQRCIDSLKGAQDVDSKTGHCIILGSLHRCVSGLVSNQHLNSSVTNLINLSSDSRSFSSSQAKRPNLQVWALHAIYLVADAGGPMFRTYVDSIVELCLRLLLTVPRHHSEVFRSIGKCLSALITAVGPELDGPSGSVSNVRNQFLIACDLLQSSSDWVVQSEAISCLQQIHMFAPRHVNFALLVPRLVSQLASPHLIVRRVGIDCLRQLSQRETKQICEIARLSQDPPSEDTMWLPMVLFRKLDADRDRKVRAGVRLILQSVLQLASENDLSPWFALSREILTTTEVGASTKAPAEETGLEGDTNDEGGEENEYHVYAPGESESSFQNSRWSTRQYAIICLRKLIKLCENRREFHFGITDARRQHRDALVLHLSELVRMAFMAATSDSDGLRMEGLELLLDIITDFYAIEEPEFPGHGILEQYQAQVGAALRPAFAHDTAPYITAKACDVCSRWVGSGVAKDINDLRRVYQLLVQSLDKLKISLKDAKIPYSESSVTLEKLSILKAWAEIYVEAIQKQRKYPELLQLVQPHVLSLSRSWLAAVRDRALLTVPPELAGQLTNEGGAFFSVETTDAARRYYEQTWLPMLYAVVTWWTMGGGFENVSAEKLDAKIPIQDAANLGLSPPKSSGVAPGAEDINKARFNLFFGSALEALCHMRSDARNEDQSALYCLRTLQKLFELDWTKSAIFRDAACPKEVLNIMHRVVLTRENPAVQAEALQVTKLIVAAGMECFQMESRKKAQTESDGDTSDWCNLGEGGASGELIPGKSIVFAAAEVYFCVLIRKFPSLNPSLKSMSVSQSITQNESAYSDLCASALSSLPQLLLLCSHRGSLSLANTIVHILVTCLEQLAEDLVPIRDNRSLAIVGCFRTLCGSPFMDSPLVGDDWLELLRSLLLRLTDVGHTFSDKRHESGVHFMLATTVIILSAPDKVSRTENVFYPCLNMYCHFMDPRNAPNVRIEALQALGKIISSPNRPLASAYVRHIAPKIFATVETELMDLNAKSAPDVVIIMEKLKLLEAFFDLLQSSANQSALVLQFLIPVFVAGLQDPSVLKVAEWPGKLHEFCTSRLVKFATGNPEGFKLAVAADPRLKVKLESALSKGKSFPAQSASDSNSTPKTSRRTATELDAPSIKLKMDFSNFSAT